jgi:peptide deformylase
MDCSVAKIRQQRVALINPEVLRVEGTQNGEKAVCRSRESSLRSSATCERSCAHRIVKGEWFELDGMELTARCMLHETDHCDGIVFLDKMSTSNARS